MIIFVRFYFDFTSISLSFLLFPQPGVSDPASVIATDPMLEAAERAFIHPQMSCLIIEVTTWLINSPKNVA